MKKDLSQSNVEFFSYSKFVDKFHGKYYRIYTLPFLMDYYQKAYPHLSAEHIEILIDKISSLLMGVFANNLYLAVFNHYFMLTKLIREEISEELFNKYLSKDNIRGRGILTELKAYKEADEQFVINTFAEERKWRHPSLAVVDNPSDYVPIIKEVLQERGSVILSYVYNYLKATMPQRFQDKNIIVPPPPPSPSTPLKASSAELTTESINIPNAKQVRFFDTPTIHPIPKLNKGKKVGQKRTREQEIIEQADEQVLKKSRPSI